MMMMHFQLQQRGRKRGSTRFGVTASLGARELAGQTHEDTRIMQVQRTAAGDIPDKEKLLAVSPCNEKLILDLQTANLAFVIPRALQYRHHHVLSFVKVRKTLTLGVVSTMRVDPHPTSY